MWILRTNPGEGGCPYTGRSGLNGLSGGGCQSQRYSVHSEASPLGTGLSRMYWIFASRLSEDRSTRSNDSVCHTLPAWPNFRLILCAEAPLIASIISARE